MFGDEITVTMLRGVWVGGSPRAPGDRVKVSPSEAHELATAGVAKFARPADAERARQAFVEELAARLRL